MANHEHFERLLPAIASGNCRTWNYWRIDNPGILPNLMAVELGGVSLPFADLSNSDLSRANLNGTNLFHANLRKADLDRTSLKNANLKEADLSNACLRQANLTDADLRRANLSSADLTGADLTGADLTGANLKGIKLTDTLIDAEALSASGVSRLEKAALMLLKRKKRNQAQRATSNPNSSRLRKHA